MATVNGALLSWRVFSAGVSRIKKFASTRSCSVRSASPWTNKASPKLSGTSESRETIDRPSWRMDIKARSKRARKSISFKVFPTRSALGESVISTSLWLPLCSSSSIARAANCGTRTSLHSPDPPFMSTEVSRYLRRRSSSLLIGRLLRSPFSADQQTDNLG